MTRPSMVSIVAVFALLIAGCASLLVYNFLKKHVGTQSQGIAIVAAAADIPVGTKLDVGQLKLATWPKEALAQGYLTDVKKLSGRVAVRPMSAGDIITEAKLMPQNGATNGGIMTYIVPQGHRAVTVAVNEVAGVAGFITPGSRVDIVLTTRRPSAGVKDDNISKIILQNVPVLATGQGTEQKEGKPVIVPTVTLDLTPEDAEKVIVGVGAGQGSLQLLLRNVIDTASINTKGATIAKVLTGIERAPVVPAARPVRVVKIVQKPALPIKAAPTPPPPPSYSLVIIRGTEKSSKQYSE